MIEKDNNHTFFNFLCHSVLFRKVFVFVEQFRPAVMASRYLINIYIVLQKDLRGHREVTLSKVLSFVLYMIVKYE